MNTITDDLISASQDGSFLREQIFRWPLFENERRCARKASETEKVRDKPLWTRNSFSTVGWSITTLHYTSVNLAVRQQPADKRERYEDEGVGRGKVHARASGSGGRGRCRQYVEFVQDWLKSNDERNGEPLQEERKRRRRESWWGFGVRRPKQRDHQGQEGSALPERSFSAAHALCMIIKRRNKRWMVGVAFYRHKSELKANNKHKACICFAISIKL